MTESALKGMEDLLRKLETLKDKTSKKAARAGINAGLSALAKRMRQSINSCNASPELKKAARETIGRRLKKDKANQYAGKAGFAVGKPTKSKKAKAILRAGDKKRRGVGMSASNIHWAVMGTAERKTGYKTMRSKTGDYQIKTKNKEHRTGKMPEILKGVLSSAVAAAEQEVLSAMQAKVSQVIAADAAKK